MKSSSGKHYIALDHIRALAAFLVFIWHFTHGTRGTPVPYDYVPLLFPLSILNEGHTGVALFMTLSGYLFAKLLEGKTIDYGAFLWNRVLRLFPLLFLVVLVVGIIKKASGEDIQAYAVSIAKGAITNSLPNGGWSITVEIHFYIILPLLLWAQRKSTLLLIVAIVAAMAIRTVLFFNRGEVQSLAYWTIVGRIDQFVMGMVLYQLRSYWTGHHIRAAVVIIGFAAFYGYFDHIGGFYNLPSYPSPSPLWIFLPTIEGFSYGVLIAWYDNSFSHASSGVSRSIGHLGEYSYSIYLLHFFVVFHAARFVNERIIDISSFTLACLWAVLFFLLMMPVGYLSFRFIEAPFLQLRKRYILAQT